jgi:hypothetical protein
VPLPELDAGPFGSQFGLVPGLNPQSRDDFGHAPGIPHDSVRAFGIS